MRLFINLLPQSDFVSSLADKHDRTTSNMSITSSVMNEEDFASLESAYGGSNVSGAVNNDVGLMMKLQAALKEVHREKDQLERKMEEMENSGGASNQQSSDLLKLQVEIHRLFNRRSLMFMLMSRSWRLKT